MNKFEHDGRRAGASALYSEVQVEKFLNMSSRRGRASVLYRGGPKLGSCTGGHDPVQVGAGLWPCRVRNPPVDIMTDRHD